MFFYVSKYAYENSFRREDSLYEHSSVRAYKRWIFECLKQHGEIVKIDEHFNKEEFFKLLNKPGAIFLLVPGSFNHLENIDIPKRVLKFSFGSLLTNPEALYKAKSLPSAQVSVVSSEFQQKRLRSLFGNLMPKMSVFPPKIDTEFFKPPNEIEKAAARKKQGIKRGSVHIVYAGRWVVTKGICQLIRILDTWPIPNIILTFAGNIDADHELVYSFARHNTFASFFEIEILQNKKMPWLRFQPAKSKEGLRELFWSADIFVNPSFQSDENFGITPREAASCGVPIITTNFCGLRPLAENMPWGGIDTYPTPFGSRFSLSQLHGLLRFAVKKHKSFAAAEYRRAVAGECDCEKARSNLRESIEYLKARAPEKPLNTKAIKQKVKKKLLESVGERAFRFFSESKKNLPEGACIYGDGPSSADYTLPLLQGIYSAESSPPIVRKGTRWRGFFRISLWDEEQAVIEFGFPGPRIKRYPKREWSSLCACSCLERTGDYTITPVDKPQISLVQGLVDIGYLVSD